MSCRAGARGAVADTFGKEEDSLLLMACCGSVQKEAPGDKDWGLGELGCLAC